MKMPALKTALPEEWYSVTITGAEVRCTQAAKGIPTEGSYLQLNLRIDKGPKKGEHFYSRITLHSKNERARHAGLRQLRQFYNSIGITRCDDCEKLIGKELCTYVVVKDWNGRLFNEVKRFVKIGSIEEENVVQNLDRKAGADTW